MQQDIWERDFGYAVMDCEACRPAGLYERTRLELQAPSYCAILNLGCPALWCCRDLNLEFEVPFRELGFHGVPHRTNSFIMPTVNCLVELTEMPFTVITLSGKLV